MRIVQTPIRTPPGERVRGAMVRTIRAECMGWMLVLGRRHLQRVPRIYADHYNEARPHRGLELNAPEPRPDPVQRPADCVRIKRRDLLGGLIHEYDLAA